MRLRSWPVPLFVPLVCAAVALAPAPPIAAQGDPVGVYLDSVRHEPDLLAAFLRDMPKGGDLHLHLGGATSTETLLRFPGGGGLCIDTVTLPALAPPWPGRGRPPADPRTDPRLPDRVLAAGSMKGI